MKTSDSFIRRHEKKLLIAPAILLVIGLVVVFMLPKPKPIDLPPIPHPQPASNASNSSKITPVFKDIVGAYQGLESKVMKGVGVPEEDREAFSKAKDQLLLCSETAEAGKTTLETCITEHMAWLVNEAKDGLVPGEH